MGGLVRVKDGFDEPDPTPALLHPEETRGSFVLFDSCSARRSTPESQHACPARGIVGYY